MKICPNCKQINAGTSGYCKPCQSVYYKTYRAKNKQKLINYKEQWEKENIEKRTQYSQKYYEINKNKIAEYVSEYKKKNKGKIVANTTKRKADKLQRTPKWLSKNEIWMMQEAYELAAFRSKLFGIKFHVDHIIPLKGKTASGLHTPYNLQVIPAKENLRKSNKLTA
jgi:5-methylcytosine-specific restriction endonuclease McrA